MSWKINLHAVEQTDGVERSRLVQSTFSVELTAGGNTTVKDFMEIIKSNCGREVNLTDLAPHDESKLGRDTGYYGQEYMAGEWQAAHENPKPVNCSWNPSPHNPLQSISEAGLVNGADVAVVEIQCLRD